MRNIPDLVNYLLHRLVSGPDIMFTNNVLAEEDDVTIQLYEKPVPETDFVKHCAQRRKYPVLLKVNILYC